MTAHDFENEVKVTKFLSILGTPPKKFVARFEVDWPNNVEVWGHIM